MTMAGKTQAGSKATSKQIRAIYAIAREQGITSDKIQKHIEKKYGKKDLKELTVKEASELIDCLRQIEQYQEEQDKNGNGIKKVRERITRIEEKMQALEEKIAVIEVKIDKILEHVIEDIEIKQGVRIAELQRQVTAMRTMLKEYFGKEEKEHEQR